MSNQEVKDIQVSELTAISRVSSRTFQSNGTNRFGLGTCQISASIDSVNATVSLNTQLIGTSETVEGPLISWFTFVGNVTQVNFELDNITIPTTIAVMANKSRITFRIFSGLELGVSYTLTGQYTVPVQSISNSSTRIAKIGWNWGTVAGVQKTDIYLEAGLSLINTSRHPHTTSAKEGRLNLGWLEVQRQSFECDIEYTTNQDPKPVLRLSVNQWNPGVVSPEDKPFLLLKMENIASYSLHCWIKSPNWIEANQTSFLLKAQGVQNIKFIISIPKGAEGELTGIIEIDAIELVEPVILNVAIKIGHSADFSIPIVIALIFGLLGIAVTISTIYIKDYWEKRTLGEDVSQESTQDEKKDFTPSLPMAEKIEQIEKEVTLPPIEVEVIERGRKIQNALEKWRTILPKREYQVLEVLCRIDGISQQAIADELGLSKATTSRLIARLEVKRLINRQRVGMSNQVFLNKKRFL